MDVLDRISQSALIPVVVLDNSGDALPTANALLSGGVDVMEITFRTDAAAAAMHTGAVPPCGGSGRPLSRLTGL